MIYAYATCECGWREDATDVYPAEFLLNKHRSECRSNARFLNIPMWSIAWPYYHSEQSVAWRAGGPTPPFGLEMAWRVPGSHSTRGPSVYDHGGMEKRWYLFATVEAA